MPLLGQCIYKGRKMKDTYRDAEAVTEKMDSTAAADLKRHTDRDAVACTDALVEKARAGSDEAFGTLVEIYERFVYHTALRTLRICGGRSDDGEDVAQKAFMKAWRGLDQFRGDCTFATWLYRITVNCAKDHCRSESRRPTVSLTPAENEEGETVEIDVPVTEGEEVPECALDRKETVKAVRKAIESLPEEMRQVIILRDLEELSYADIASLTGIEVGTVKSRISRGRSVLRELLQGLL